LPCEKKDAKFTKFQKWPKTFEYFLNVERFTCNVDSQSKRKKLKINSKYADLGRKRRGNQRLRERD
jgi:hypothetical protein